jgi:Ferritin-like domain
VLDSYTRSCGHCGYVRRRRSSPVQGGVADRASVPENAAAATAVAESATRGELLLRALAAAGTVGAGGLVVGSLAGSAASAPSPAQDVRILNHLLLLEYLQEGLYKEARSADVLTGELRRFAEVAGDHEREHVESLRAVLGDDARSKPELQFGQAVENDRRFAAAALTLEETAAAAYIGQAANLSRKRTTTIARIVPVEARHAAWIRGIVHRLPAPYATDPARTPQQVERTIRRTGFVEQR